MATAKTKYHSDDALKVINGPLMTELSIHSFNDDSRSKAHLFAVKGARGSQFAIVLGDFDKSAGRYERQQTRIVLECCVVPWLEGVDLIDGPYKSSRLKNQDSKISPPNQSSVFVHDELALKRLLRWYAEVK
jgi:hypothetical protein